MIEGSVRTEKGSECKVCFRGGFRCSVKGCREVQAGVVDIVCTHLAVFQLWTYLLPSSCALLSSYSCPQLFVGVADEANATDGGEALQQPMNILTSPLWLKVDSFLHLMTVEVYLPENFYTMKKKPAQAAESTSEDKVIV